VNATIVSSLTQSTPPHDAGPFSRVLRSRSLVGPLANVYRTALGAEGEAHPGLELRLSELCARGRAAHPTLGLDDETFVAHFARCRAPVEELAELHAEDLYLACACLTGDAAAIAQLRAKSKPVLARYLSRIRNAKANFEEVEQRLWDAVLVGGESGPKLGTYAGRGALGAWIGVSAQRIALMSLRHELAETRARREIAARAHLSDDDPEMVAIKARFRPQFHAAVEAALSRLDDRGKTLYRMHLVEGHTLEHIARAYGVHHTTVLRWLDAAHERVLDDAKRELRATLPVSSGEFDSIARLLLSQLDLNISRVLGQGS
jgi:RNA polymerase sigma-70 factor (ECF subfamily)